MFNGTANCRYRSYYAGLQASRQPNVMSSKWRNDTKMRQTQKLHWGAITIGMVFATLSDIDPYNPHNLVFYTCYIQIVNLYFEWVILIYFMSIVNCLLRTIVTYFLELLKVCTHYMYIYYTCLLGYDEW